MAYGATNPDDEDLRSRYATETKGRMPTYLANIAANNLATQDASITKVNAAGRLNPSPGVGAIGSTPETDAANMSVVRGMAAADRFAGDFTDSPVSTPVTTSLADAHVDDIMARRDQIDQKRKEIMANLGMISPADAGFAAVVLPSTDKQGQLRRKEMLQNLAVLEGQSNDLLREHQLTAIDATKTAHENLVRQTHIQVANGKAKIFSGLADINEQYAKDSPEHRLAVLKLFGSNDPDIAAARGNNDFETLVRPFIDQHDRSVATAERIKQAVDDFRAATGREPESVEVTSSGGINIRSGSVGGGGTDTAKQLQQLHKITPNELLNPVSVKRGKPDEANKFTNSYPEAASGPLVQIDTGSRVVTMSNAEYERYKSALQPKSAAVGEAPPPVSATAPPAFIVGKQYRDAKGNVATYVGDGNWK